MVPGDADPAQPVLAADLAGAGEGVFVLPVHQRGDGADPHESKGIVGRANGYLETSFLPRREFASPADNTQLGDWLVLANGRKVRSLGGRPSDLITADRAKMLALPPIALEVGFGQ